MYNCFKKKVRGYLTVEASLIIPIVVLLIALILNLAFFLYSRCILSQDAYILAFRGSIRKQESGEEIRRYIEESFKNHFGRRYFGISDLEKNIETNTRKVTVRINAGTAMKWSLEAAGEAERIDPAIYIRKIRLIKKAGEKLKNIDWD